MTWFVILRGVADPGQRVVRRAALLHQPAAKGAEPPQIALAGFGAGALWLTVGDDAAATAQRVNAGEHLGMGHIGRRGELPFAQNPAAVALDGRDVFGRFAVAGQVLAIIGEVLAERAARVLFLFARRGKALALLVRVRLAVLQLSLAGGLVGEQRDPILEAVGAGEIAVPLLGNADGLGLARRSLRVVLGLGARELAVGIVEAGRDLAGELVPVGLATDAFAVGVEITNRGDTKNGHAGFLHRARRAAGRGLYSAAPTATAKDSFDST
ncbi:MAG TPA: hypothetical protein VMV69_18400 [Pirellulales bacterium]|nr:hypothetical protein [Pirellulales bacterium]